MSPNVPPIGQRFRLKASYNISSYSPQTRVSVAARKKYATVFADNGGGWFINGRPDAGWHDSTLVSELATATGFDCEAVDELRCPT